MSRPRCHWPMCGDLKWDRLPGMELCQKHALHVWAQVNTDIEGGQVRRPRTAKPKTAGAGSIYYLRIGDRIKVGYATDLAQRLRTYPPSSIVVAVHPGTLDDEKRLHARLALHRADGREWYHATDDMRLQLETLLAQHPGSLRGTTIKAMLKPPQPDKPPAVRVRKRMGLDRPRVVK